MKIIKHRRINALFMVVALMFMMVATAYAGTDGMKVTLVGSDGTSIDGTFEVLDTAGNNVRFRLLSTGRYQVDPAGTVTRIATNNGTVTIKDTDITTYTLVQRTTSGGYIVALNQSITITTADQDNVVAVSVVNQAIATPTPAPTPTPLPTPTPTPIIEGKVRLTLYDNQGKAVQGAVYGVYDMSNTHILSMTSDASGRAMSVNIPLGTYTVKAISVPSTHELPSDSKTFSIVNQNYLIDFSIVLQAVVQKGTIQITVVDSKNNPIVGAVYGIYDSNGTKIADLTTDTNGYAQSNAIPVGTYSLGQVSTLQGKVSETKTSVSVSAGTSAMTRITNDDSVKKITGRIRVNVLENTDKKDAVYGVIFTVYKSSDNSKVMEISTDANGIALSSEMEAGSYYLKAMSVPSQYKSEKEKQISFMITADQTLDMNYMLDKAEGKAKILVQDNEKKGVSGASLTIYNYDDDKRVSDATTGADGSVSVSLSFGKYYIKQNSAPSGYTANSDKVTFTIDKSEEITVSITNTKTGATATSSNAQTGTMKITSIGESSDEKVDGVVYGIFKSEDDSKVDEIVSGSDGTATKNLVAGTYYVKMIKAKLGYALNEEKNSFTIEVNKTAELTLKNVRQTGVIHITAIDLEEKELEGVTVSIFNEEGDSVSEVTTDENGKGKSDKLPMGTYTLSLKKVPEGYKLNKKDKRTVVLDKAKGNAEFVLEQGKGTLLIQYKNVDTQAEIETEYSYTDFVGRDYMTWLRNSGYDRKSITGYTFVRADYPADSKLIDGTLTIVYWYSGSGAGNLSAGSGGNFSSGVSTSIPKTGELLPVMNYALGLISSLGGASMIVFRKRFLIG